LRKPGFRIARESRAFFQQCIECLKLQTEAAIPGSKGLPVLGKGFRKSCPQLYTPLPVGGSNGAEHRPRQAEIHSDACPLSGVQATNSREAFGCLAGLARAVSGKQVSHSVQCQVLSASWNTFEATSRQLREGQSQCGFNAHRTAAPGGHKRMCDRGPAANVVNESQWRCVHQAVDAE